MSSPSTTVTRSSTRRLVIALALAAAAVMGAASVSQVAPPSSDGAPGTAGRAWSITVDDGGDTAATYRTHGRAWS